MFITANIISDALAPLIAVFEKLLVGIHAVIPSWGLSIIVMTVVIRAALIPLTLKQIRSMQAMRELGPEIKAMQEKYKGDRQRMNEEMMKFYRDNQINPLASCLPLLAQAPVFISLFYMLQQDLKPHICPNITSYAASINKSVSQVACGQVPGSTDQKFLFIPDLTAKATGAVLVVLIVLYVGSQLGSSLVMMQPTMDKTQRYIMFALPLIFVVFIINFPAGLMVYWITTNLWTVGQQWVVKKTSPPLKPVVAGAGSGSGSPPEPGEAKKGSGGFMARLMDASAAASAEKAERDAAKSSGTKAKGGKAAKGDAGTDKGSSKKASSSSNGDGDGEGKPSGKKSGPPPQRNKKKRTGRRR
ncbi:MAG: YidC/Oxa1 family membrane protein insertase [Alsobacter sp.]